MICYCKLDTAFCFGMWEGGKERVKKHGGQEYYMLSELFCEPEPDEGQGLPMG